MKNTKSMLFAVGLTLIICSSCFNSTKVPLSDEQLSWNPYKDGQVLRFHSNKGDTSKIKIFALNQGYNEGIWPPQNELFSVWAWVDGPNGREYNTDIFSINAENIRENNPYPAKVYFSFHLMGGQFKNDEIDYNTLKHYPQKSITIDGINYKDVLVFEDSLNWKNKYDQDILTLLWSKQYGYIQAFTRDSTIWTLIRDF